MVPSKTIHSSLLKIRAFLIAYFIFRVGRSTFDTFQFFYFSHRKNYFVDSEIVEISFISSHSLISSIIELQTIENILFQVYEIKRYD